MVTLTSDSSICVNQCFGTLTSSWWGFTENVDAPQGGADFVSFQAGWLILACVLAVTWGFNALRRKPTRPMLLFGIVSAILVSTAVAVQFRALSTFTHFWVKPGPISGWNRVDYGIGRPTQLLALGIICLGVAIYEVDMLLRATSARTELAEETEPVVGVA